MARPPGKKKIKHSGYVALIGRTNVGKSTFLNAVMEAKIAIVSDKPQTTRKRILGIKTTPSGQIIFFDSPGIHQPYFKLNERMMQDVHHSLFDADLILYFIDIDTRTEDEFALSLFREIDKNVFLVINKIDKYSKGKILERISFFKDIYPWAEVVPISALKGDNLELIEDLIFKYLPENDYFFPVEETTQQSEIFYIAELIREKVLDHTRNELPFTTMVKIEEMTQKEKVLFIRAEIYVERPSQRRIIIGKRGHMIKSIGEQARAEIEEHVEKQVFLDLYIKVAPNWRDSHFILDDLNQ